jgi:transposase-like protein|tara:strand:- start:389 stop:889 length:501 start_codon:yes stop_codon:yes gene_type:complete
MGYKVYSNEFKAQVVEFYKTHSTYETIKEFDVSRTAITNWCKQLGFFKGYSNYKISFKHEVCQYYDNNTLDQTYAKYGIPSKTVCRWRRELGYRNKSRGYNLYMEGLQPTMQKRERRDFVMTKMENGDLKGQIVELQKVVSDMSLDNQWLKDKLTRIADAIKTMEV